ncbi:MAG: HlyD family efflux transporter periplasmic adaptor subunit, partial [Rubrivivax sp.]
MPHLPQRIHPAHSIGAQRVRLAAALLVALLPAACGREAPPAWSGYVEAEFVYVSSPLAGTLTRLDVQRGQTVARGAPLFALDSSSERDARNEAAARLASARAQAADTTKGRRSDEIAVTQAQLAQARAQADLADAELARRRALVAQNFISAAQLDDAKAAAEQAHGRVAELQAALRVAQLPARSDERVAAAATAQAASAALAQAAWREQQKQQSAPADALVSDTVFQVGEWVNAGQPVVALLPPTATRARFYVAEAEVGAIAAGQRVLIECSGCGAA